MLRRESQLVGVRLRYLDSRRQRGSVVIEQIGAVLNRNLFERNGDVQAFALNPLARDPTVWRKPGAGPLVEAMNGYVRLYGMYRLILLVSPQGEVLAASSVDANGRPIGTDDLYARSIAGETWFRRLPRTDGSQHSVVLPTTKISWVGQLYGDEGQVVLFAAPVLDVRGHVIAIWINFFDFSKVGSIARDMVNQRLRIQ